MANRGMILALAAASIVGLVVARPSHELTIAVTAGGAMASGNF